MDSINTKSHYSPATFRGEITLPPTRARAHVDPATTVLLQNASGVATNDLPAPQQIILSSAVQARLEKLADGYVPNVRKVLAEADALQDEVILRRREREAQGQAKAWEYGYQATLKTDEGSKLQRDGKFLQLSGQAVGGAIETRSAYKGLKRRSEAGGIDKEAVKSEKLAAGEKRSARAERREAARLEKEIDTLENSRNGDPQHDRMIDDQLAQTRSNLAAKYEAIDRHEIDAQDHAHTASNARKTERELENNDTQLALARGKSAVLNGMAGMGAAQLDHEGDLEKSKAQRLQLMRDQEESTARNAGSAADKAESARGKLLDFSAEVTRLERPADLA